MTRKLDAAALAGCCALGTAITGSASVAVVLVLLAAGAWAVLDGRRA